MELAMDSNTYSYDVTQYESFPYKQTHPNHLYTLGSLFGLKPKPYATARILELGCASGGNLIPMACGAPESECIGIDLSIKQIEEGRQVVKSLRLKNIELRHQSILDFHASEGQFDYIICHGIYSWVDEPIRNKIMQIFRENLTEQGIVFVSYNTLPGWNMVKSIRDMMKYHIQNFNTPQEKATQARSMLKFILAGIKDQKTPYSNFLESEINLLSKQSDNYLLHDHLEDINHALYFYEFFEHAKQNRLNYLADTEISHMFPANLPAGISQEISKITDIVRLGQYMDFVRNQRFRQTLLCHESIVINRNLQTDQIMDFHLKFEGVVEGDENALSVDEAPLSFRNNLITLTVKNYFSKMAMWLLSQQKKPIFYQDFVTLLAKETRIQDRNKIQHMLNQELNLMRLALGGIITLSCGALHYALKPPTTLRSTPLVQHQLLRSSLVTNQRHEVVRLNEVEKVLLKLCDGTQGLQQIGHAFAEKLIAEKVRLLKEDGSVIQEKEEIYRRSEYISKELLNLFAQNALLLDA